MVAIQCVIWILFDQVFATLAQFHPNGRTQPQRPLCLGHSRSSIFAPSPCLFNGSIHQPEGMLKSMYWLIMRALSRVLSFSVDLPNPQKSTISATIFCNVGGGEGAVMSLTNVAGLKKAFLISRIVSSASRSVLAPIPSASRMAG